MATRNSSNIQTKTRTHSPELYRYQRVPKSARIVPIVFITIVIAALLFLLDGLLSQKYSQLIVENKIVLAFYCVVVGFVLANIIDFIRGISDKSYR